MDICAKYTHYSDVAIVAIMALVVKFYSFNDGLFIGTLLAMSMFTIRYSGRERASIGFCIHFKLHIYAYMILYTSVCQR